jgi:hypothetical protein
MNNSTAMEYISAMTIGSISNNIALICIIYIIDTSDIISLQGPGIFLG